jgi:ribokinase
VRAREALARSGVQLDALVASANDRAEHYRRGDIEPTPASVVRTDGAAGGSLEMADGRISRWAPAPLPGPPVDNYGAGGAFAGGLTYGLGQGLSVEKALALGARCGAAAVTVRGPYDSAGA